MAKGDAKRWVGLAFLGVALLIISIDNTVLNVALPSIANQLGATASGLQWIVDSYTLVFAAFLLTAGSVGDPDRPETGVADRSDNFRGRLTCLRLIYL